MSEHLDLSMKDQLKDFVRRINNIKKEQQDLSTDLRELYKEVASCGFDVKIVREVVKRMNKPKEEMSINEEMIHAYMNAIYQDDRNDNDDNEDKSY